MKDIIILANARRPVPERVRTAAVMARMAVPPAPLRRSEANGGLACRWQLDAATGRPKCRRSSGEAAAEADAGIGTAGYAGTADRRAILRHTGSGCRRAA